MKKIAREIKGKVNKAKKVVRDMRLLITVYSIIKRWE